MSPPPFPFPQDKLAAAVDLLKKLSHPSRLMILARLADGQTSVADLETSLNLRQPGLSQQLAELRNAGIIEPRREAKGVVYRLADARAAEIVSVVRGLFLDVAPKTGMSHRASVSSNIDFNRLFGASVFAKVGEPS